MRAQLGCPAREGSNRRLGTIRDSTDYLQFESLAFDGKAPDIPLTGEIDGHLISNHSAQYWCGTFKRQVFEGTYDLDIVLLGEGHRRSLLLALHDPNRAKRGTAATRGRSTGDAARSRGRTGPLNGP